MSVECKKKNEDYFMLRLIATPYVIFSVIVLFQLVLLTPYALRTHDWVSFMYVILESLLIFGFVCYSMRYRIWWQDGKIFQKAADKTITSIGISEIKLVRRETSGIQNSISFARPSTRISLYKDVMGGSTAIDISLIHFNKEDICRLMKMIHEKRPDLDMPKGWE